MHHPWTHFDGVIAANLASCTWTSSQIAVLPHVNTLWSCDLTGGMWAARPAALANSVADVFKRKGCALILPCRYSAYTLQPPCVFTAGDCRATTTSTTDRTLHGSTAWHAQPSHGTVVHAGRLLHRRCSWLSRHSPMLTRRHRPAGEQSTRDRRRLHIRPQRRTCPLQRLQPSPRLRQSHRQELALLPGQSGAGTNLCPMSMVAGREQRALLQADSLVGQRTRRLMQPLLMSLSRSARA